MAERGPFSPEHGTREPVMVDPQGEQLQSTEQAPSEPAVSRPAAAETDRDADTELYEPDSSSTGIAPTFRSLVPKAAPKSRSSRPSTALPEVGQTYEDFELIRVLGSGSFAKVFLARQLSLDRQVALKISANRGSEAKTLASLEHDHIVHVFSELVDRQKNLRLLCMQYVAGTT